MTKDNIIKCAGLCDVVGGKLWYVVASPLDLKAVLIGGVWHFYTKKECAKYIREWYKGESKKIALNQLKACKGRAFINM